MVVGNLESRPITTALKLNWGMNHHLRNSADELPQPAPRDACQEPAVNMAVLGLIRVQRTLLSDSVISSSPSGWLTRYSHSARGTINSSPRLLQDRSSLRQQTRHPSTVGGVAFPTLHTTNISV